MGFDANLKRFFPAVLLLLIAVAAFFQASGMGQLVSSALAVDPSSLPSAPMSPRAGLAAMAAAGQGSERATSGEAIIKRNPFDSVTGPLDQKPVTVTDQGPAPPPPNSADPYEDPPCEVAKAVMIIASSDPAWSFASLMASDGKSQLRRQGDDIAGFSVEFIGDRRDDERRVADEANIDRRGRVWDRVWLTNGTGQRCVIEVGAKIVPKGPKEDKKKKEEPKKSNLPSEISSKIHKIGPNEYNVERAAIDTILENQAELMKSARIVPEKEGDKMVGIRLFGIKPDSMLGALGLENGDRLGAINGFEMSDPQKALEAYAKLRTSDHLTVAINRRGAPMNIDFNIK